jgi:hypothetical protein
MESNDILKIAEFIDLYNKLIKLAYIRKLPNGKYRVFSEKGKNMGTYTSMSAAKKRLRQIEFFKHKKADKVIDLTNIDGNGYSAIVRELNKLGDTKAMQDFLSLYKKSFDKFVLDGNEHPADNALSSALLEFGKQYHIKLPERVDAKTTASSK